MRGVVVVALFSGCSFAADYGGGTYTCSDGKCPSGLSCVAEVCVDPTMIDAPVDLPIDEAVHALTCADPGAIALGGSESGTTTGKPSNLGSMCGGFVMNGKEAVYKIELTGSAVVVGVTGQRKAYVIAQCVVPAPACLGNAFATEGNPISVTPAVGASFIVVDDENPANDGSYTVTAN